MAETVDVVLQGGCLCGHVRYEVRPDSLEGYYCHCRMCQLAFGNTRAAFLNVPRAAVRWVTPPQQYASSKFALRGFCANCGTPLSFEYLGSKRIDMSVGSLDEPQRVRPVQALWMPIWPRSVPATNDSSSRSKARWSSSTS